MEITVLSHEEMLATGFTHKVKIPYTDCTAETSGTAFEIFPKLTVSSPTIPAGTIVEKAAVYVETAFAFAPGTLAIEVGDGGDAARFVASGDVKTTGWRGPAPTKCPHQYASADTIDIKLTAGVGALSSITDGLLYVFLALKNPNSLV